MAYPLQFLIDECLSPALVDTAASFGAIAYHAIWHGLSHRSDRTIAALCIERDLVAVTANGPDYRMIYSRLDVHPGLIVLPGELLRGRQIALFEMILDRLRGERDLVNQLLEIDMTGVFTLQDFARD